MSQFLPNETFFTVNESGHKQGWSVASDGTPQLDDRVMGTRASPKSGSWLARAQTPHRWLAIIVALVAGAAIGIAGYGWVIGDRTAQNLAIVLVIAIGALLVCELAVSYYHRNNKLVT